MHKVHDALLCHMALVGGVVLLAICEENLLPQLLADGVQLSQVHVLGAGLPFGRCVWNPACPS